MNILFLTLRTFSLTGGIENVCRAFSKALSELNAVNMIGKYNVLSLYDDKPDENYLSSEHFTGFSNRRIRFSFSTFKKSRLADILIISHINLLVFAWLIKKISPKKRIILLAHGIEVWGNQRKWKINFLQNACEVWAVSGFTAQKMIEKHIPAHRIEILHNCLDPFYPIPDIFEKPKYLLDRYRLDASQKILFTLARISSAEQYKGYDEVVTALKKIVSSQPNVHYILAGKADDIEKNRLEKLIATNGLTNYVSLVGFINQKEVRDHYLMADVYVMPSKGEGFGICFIEAATAGCNIIAGNADGSVDALLGGKLGLLINPDDTGALVAALNNSLVKPRDLAHSKSLQSLCLTHFSFEQYKNNILNLLRSN